MPTFFDVPDESTVSILEDVMNEYHTELVNAKVNVGIIICRKETKEGFSLEAFPPALARVRPTPRKQRLYCEHDAIIEICHLRWENSSTATKKAIIDHELTHLQVREKNGEAIIDDLGRPLLRMRKDEIDLTAFPEVISRHGINAIEWQSISNAYQRAGASLLCHGTPIPAPVFRTVEGLAPVADLLENPVPVPL